VNYRHLYHAGNYADVFKHALLVRLVRGLQRKEKGILYLDTHAGRGGYDLGTTTLLPDGRERAPEWPEGIGRVWSDHGDALRDYLDLVRRFNCERGGDDSRPCFYPGSPRLVAGLARPVDRLALCELQPDEAEALDADLGRRPRISVHAMDGYTALRAMLPPPEKRALVLIDPPFEAQEEFAVIRNSLAEGLRRFAGGVYAVWYPITDRARSERFWENLLELSPPPTLAAELRVAAENTQVRMKGCGLVVINPPWRIEDEFRAVLAALASGLGLPAASTRLHWLVPDS